MTETDKNKTMFREVEKYNLFSQGNIYTTQQIIRPVRSDISSKSINSLGQSSTHLLVGTLKPPKILSIVVPNMAFNDPLLTAKDEGINIIDSFIHIASNRNITCVCQIKLWMISKQQIQLILILI